MKIEKQVKVLTGGNAESDKVLIVLHGYGQLAQYFIRKFESVGQDFHIIAPEGPHRFYLEGFSGRVGASWMTKEQREWDIEDNLAYLEQVVEKYGLNKEVYILGFSQGGATAARYVAQSKYPIKQFVLWASVLPEEFTSGESTHLPLMHKSFVLGTNDSFFTVEQQKEIIHSYTNFGFTCHSFEGNHDIHTNTLVDVLKMPTFGTLSAKV